MPFVEVRDIQVSMDGQDEIGKALMKINVVFFINTDAANLQSVEFEVTSGEEQMPYNEQENPNSNVKIVNQ